MTVLRKRGSPLPYRLEARGQPLAQVAIAECTQCGKEATFPWRNDNTQNPTAIVQRFVRMGWEFYRNSKRRCPECVSARIRQKTTHARLDEEAAMQTPKPHVQLVKPTPARRDQTFLLTIDGTTGGATIRPMEGAIEMMFGDKMFLVLPFAEVTE